MRLPPYSFQIALLSLQNNSMEGWICLHRKIREWGWYADRNTCAVFLELLLTANYHATFFLGVPVPIGAVITGRKSLALTLGISERNVRTALTHLKSTNEVTIKNYSKFSVVTILKWDKYQSIDQQSDQQVTSIRPASDQQVTTSNKETINKGTKEVTPLPPWLPVIEWEAYQEMRKKIRKPMTSHAEQLAIKKLENFQFEGKNIVEILNYSILNNYQGIFEPKQEGQNYGKPKQTKLDLIADGIAKARAARKREEQGQTG